MNAKFVRYSTDQEIAKFVQIMRSGSEDEQRRAVEAAFEKPWKSLGLR